MGRVDDGGVGWTLGNRGYFDGLARLKPLLPVTSFVVFTVPTDLQNGDWTSLLPNGDKSALVIGAEQQESVDKAYQAVLQSVGI